MERGRPKTAPTSRYTPRFSPRKTIAASSGGRLCGPLFMLEGVMCASTHRPSGDKSSGRILGNGGHDQCHDHEARKEIRRENRRLAQKGNARQTRIRSIQPSFVKHHIGPQSDIRRGETHIFDDPEPQRIRRIGLIGEKGGPNASDEQHSCGDGDQCVPRDAQRHGDTFGRRANGGAQRNRPSRMRFSPASRRGSPRIIRRYRYDAAETAGRNSSTECDAQRARIGETTGRIELRRLKQNRTHGFGNTGVVETVFTRSRIGIDTVRQKYSSMPSAYTSLRTVVWPKPNCSGGA